MNVRQHELARAKLHHTAGQRREVVVGNRRRVLVYRPIPDAHRGRGAAAPFALATAPSSNLRHLNPYGCLDQIDTGSCWAHATAKGLVIGFAGADQQIGFLPSTDALYKNARSYARIPRPDGSFYPLSDDGTIPNVGLEAVNVYGVKPSKAVDVSDISDDPNVLNAEPELGDLEQEAKFIPVEDGTIEDCSIGRSVQAVEADLVATLTGSEHQPHTAIGLGTWVATSFMNWTPDQPPCGAQNLNDPNGGGHAILIVGHRPAASGQGVDFLIDNSWGESWGLDGAIWVSRAFIAQVTDLVPYRAKRKA